jgi:putative transposase
MGRVEFVNGERYHIYNRGTDKRDVFMDVYDYQRFLLGMREFNTGKMGVTIREMIRIEESKDEGSCRDRISADSDDGQLVRVIAYCLNPNHYHFILEQVSDDGISKFMQKIGIAYTMYFNEKYHRSGSLFQGRFKAVHIDSNEYLLYLSVYVSTNNFIHGGKNSKWPYSSWLDYASDVSRNTISTFIPTGFCRDWISAYYTCDKSIVMDQFGGSVEEYKKFAEMNAEHLKNKKMLGKYLLE